MSQYQRLLLIADPTMCHYGALRRALALAQVSRAELHIACFVPPVREFDSSFHEVSAESLLNERRQWLQEETKELSSKGIQVTIEVFSNAHPLEQILLHVRQLHPDMLIKDVQHESVLKRVFITPLDCHLLRECPVPVHLVSADGHALPRKVLAAVDLVVPADPHTALNDQIMQVAQRLALQCDAELHLLHTYDMSFAYLLDGAGGAVAYSWEYVEELRSTQLNAFNAFADGYGVPAAHRHFILGTPTHSVTEFALHARADVLVMGARGEQRGLGKLLSNTTEYVLYQSPCNVLAVKTDATAS